MNEQSSIEIATESVIDGLNDAIAHEWKANRVPVPEKQFRRILAGYFERQTMREWCELLGIASDPE